MLATLKEVLDKANRQKYAVGAFNVNNLETFQSVINAGERQKSPVIVQTSEGAINYAGLDYLFSIIKTGADKSKIPVVIHLDHGTDFDIIKKCIKIGYSSVMIDASKYSLNRNVRVTAKVVRLAHKNFVSVEGELGVIRGKEDLITSKKIRYTCPDEAKEFIEKTGIDALAIAIGTSHGAYKFKGKEQLDITRLIEIKKRVKIPLVLHGASQVPWKVVNELNRYGGELTGVSGISDLQIKKAVKYGINKINTDTDLRLGFTAAVRKVLKQNPKVFDPRQILAPARELMQKIVEHRICVFGSVNKL